MWLELALFIVSAVLSIALRPKVKPPPAATMSDVNLPTIKSGTPVYVVFGDVWIDNWFVLWYGDMSTTPIKEKSGKKG
jgi:hypothetical protein